MENGWCKAETPRLRIARSEVHHSASTYTLDLGHLQSDFSKVGYILATLVRSVHGDWLLAGLPDGLIDLGPQIFTK